MKKPIVSLEYCHVTPDTDWTQEIALANQYAPKVVKMLHDVEIQKCIMIDDLQSSSPLTQKQINDIVNSLEVKPDVIYLESSFVFPAADLISHIDSRIAKQRADKEELWLKSVKDTYGSLNEFLLSWKKKDGVVKFSCPTLVASSYLFRSGIIDSGDIEIIYGTKIKKADRLLNLLSARYLQVEANAQLLLKASSPQIVDTIQWHFI